MNKIYRTVIIDDEESAIDNLCLALKPYGQIVVEGWPYGPYQQSCHFLNRVHDLF